MIWEYIKLDWLVVIAYSATAPSVYRLLSDLTSQRSWLSCNCIRAGVTYKWPLGRIIQSMASANLEEAAKWDFDKTVQVGYDTLILFDAGPLFGFAKHRSILRLRKCHGSSLPPSTRYAHPLALCSVGLHEDAWRAPRGKIHRHEEVGWGRAWDSCDEV